MIIKPQWIDVQGTSAPGNLQFPGALKRDPVAEAPGKLCGFFGDRMEVFPESEWRTIYDEYKPSLRPFVNQIKDQGREGSCTSNAGTGLWQTLAKWQYDVDFVLSAMSLYKRCGSGPNSGSTVGCNMRRLRDEGALPAPQMRELVRRAGLNPDHCHPETGFRNRLPTGWQETAKHFRLEEFYELRGIDEFVSALLQGYGVHYGRRGHSIYAVALTYDNGSPLIQYANSWAPTWGDHGFGYDTVSGLRRHINAYGAFAYNTVLLPDALIDPPPRPEPAQKSRKATKR